jgi:hypothetical protein
MCFEIIDLYYKCHYTKEEYNKYIAIPREHHRRIEEYEQRRQRYRNWIE